jgi:hypothetical protein
MCGGGRRPHPSDKGLTRACHLARVFKDPMLKTYCIWRKKETEPALKARVVEANVVCRPDIMVHVVDRIIFTLG